MSLKTNWTCQIMVLMLLILPKHVQGVAKLTIDCMNGGYPGKSTTVVCKLTGMTDEGMRIMRPNSGSPQPVLICNSENNLCLALGLIRGYSAIASSLTRTTTVTIESFNASYDAGEWTCYVGKKELGQLSTCTKTAYAVPVTEEPETVTSQAVPVTDEPETVTSQAVTTVKPVTSDETQAAVTTFKPGSSESQAVTTVESQSTRTSVTTVESQTTFVTTVESQSTSVTTVESQSTSVTTVESQPTTTVVPETSTISQAVTTVKPGSDESQDEVALLTVQVESDNTMTIVCRPGKIIDQIESLTAITVERIVSNDTSTEPKSVAKAVATRKFGKATLQDETLRQRALVTGGIRDNDKERSSIQVALGEITCRDSGKYICKIDYLSTAFGPETSSRDSKHITVHRQTFMHVTPRKAASAYHENETVELRCIGNVEDSPQAVPWSWQWAYADNSMTWTPYPYEDRIHDGPITPENCTGQSIVRHIASVYDGNRTIRCLVNNSEQYSDNFTIYTGITGMRTTATPTVPVTVLKLRHLLV
ncbi:serine-rich adhesin for platelets-like [Gigantopelta aegis]|uniref:serine-rich adhesin for platelets-like n=1 Tax=Gigantopelta aegis TaxID=1735272 RepID=UPI001B88B49B|nr:serine-rich adhesin for platelets-like [Gigantopelta aegis]